MFGPHALLDQRRSADDAPRSPTLLHPSPHACRATRTYARPERRPGPRTHDSHIVSLAGALSRAVPNTDRRMTDGPADRRLSNLALVSNVYLSFSALR